MKGRDVQASVRVPFETAMRGGSVDLSLSRNGTAETLGVKIPAGVSDGNVMRLAGQGEPSPSGGPAGDLLLTIQIEPHELFIRKERDIHCEISISLPEAVLGGSVPVPTVHGPVALKVPPGSNSGTMLRLKGKGLAGKVKRNVLPIP